MPSGPWARRWWSRKRGINIRTIATRHGGLVPAIHVLLCGEKDVDGRDKRGHDMLRVLCRYPTQRHAAAVTP